MSAACCLGAPFLFVPGYHRNQGLLLVKHHRPQRQQATQMPLDLCCSCLALYLNYPCGRLPVWCLQTTGRTPLLLAVQNRHELAVQTLIDAVRACVHTCVCADCSASAGAVQV